MHSLMRALSGKCYLDRNTNLFCAMSCSVPGAPLSSCHILGAPSVGREQRMDGLMSFGSTFPGANRRRF